MATESLGPIGTIVQDYQEGTHTILDAARLLIHLHGYSSFAALELLDPTGQEWPSPETFGLTP